MSTAVRLRPLEPPDWEQVLALNEAEVPRVATMDRARAEWIRALSDRFDVIEVDGEFAGSVVTLAPGTVYDSKNYRWFSDRYGERFYYLDRVAVAPDFRRRGVARAVYDELEAVAAAYDRMALEVNVIPRNEPSLAFHTARGYAEVGQLGDDSYRVSLMTKELAGG
jgi:predicted GNAT superfamily acetyltransferase